MHATLHTLGGFSAHAGRHELLDWIRSADRKPSKVFLCHGEPAAAESLGAAIRDELHLETYVPSLGERVEI